MRYLLPIIISILIMFSFSASAGVFAAEARKKESSSTKVVLTRDNSVTLSDAVYTDTANKVVQQVLELDARIKSKDPIYLVLDTPGGSISAGLEMIENLRNVNRPIHTITVNAYSMGFETVQGLGDRLITRDGTLMSHKAWGVMYGEFPGQFDSRYAHSLRRSKRMAERAVARTNGKHTLASYSALIENEFWCDGNECLKEGFADKIVAAQCDKSLSGTYVKTIDQWSQVSMFGLAVIEIKLKKSECPLNTGYLTYDIYINGKPLFGNIEQGPDIVKFKNSSEAWDSQSEKYIEKPILSTVEFEKIKQTAQDKLQSLVQRRAIVRP